MKTPEEKYSFKEFCDAIIAKKLWAKFTASGWELSTMNPDRALYIINEAYVGNGIEYHIGDEPPAPSIKVGEFVQGFDNPYDKDNHNRGMFGKLMSINDGLTYKYTVEDRNHVSERFAYIQRAEITFKGKVE